MMQYDIISILLLASTLFSIFGASVGWTKRNKPSAIPMALLGLCTAIWSFFYFMEYISPDLQTKLFWATAKFPAVSFLPITVAAFVLRFAGWLDWPNKRTLVAVSIIPLLTIIIVFTNPYHHFFWRSNVLEQYQGFVALQSTYGFWFWVHVVYSYGIIVISTTVALSSLGSAWYLYRRQAMLLATGLLISFLGSTLSVFKLHPWAGLDISPIAFGVSTIFLLVTTQLVSILNVVPLAHAALLEQLRDGLIVLSNQNIIMELNKAAEEIIGMPRQSMIGKNLNKFDHPALKMLNQASDGQTIHREIRLGNADEPHWYEARISSISTKSGFLAGRMVIWHEFTDRKQVEEKLRYASTHDQLTGLYNRMYFDEAYKRLERSDSWPVAILMIDLDNLKETNDRYGHAVGDQLLKHAATVLRQSFRREDIVSRIGGDEFAIIIPHCNANDIEKLVSRLQATITQPLNLLPNTKLGFSVGFAIANNPEELQSANNRADQQMYADKNRRKINQSIQMSKG